jgi:DNA-binding NarL/FixJ family response regulator
VFQVSPIRAGTATRSYVVVERSSDSDSERRVAAAANRWQLTRAESRVFRRLAGGISNKAIARDLDCSVRTVELHVSAILKKAHSRSRAELIVKLWGHSLDAQRG